MRHLLPLLFLACASPSEYQRGTFTPPPPAPVRTGVGAPVIGQPGMQPRTIPRGGDRRVLPPTRGPGIWASDKPKTVPAIPMIAGVALPYPPDVASADEKVMGRLCAAHMTHAIADTDTLQRIMQLGEAARICVAMRLYEHCTSLTRAFMAEIAATRPGVVPEANRRLAAAYDKTAKALAQRECAPPARSDEENDIMRAVMSAYDRIIHATGL